MSDKINPKNTDDIDLIQLFNYFGKIIKKLNLRLKSFLVWLFDNLVLVLLFIKKQSIKISIAVILGACFGYFLQRNEAKLYSSEMIVHPNFESSRQVYTSIEYLNQLAITNNVEKLSEELRISKEEASSIISLYCKPILEEHNKIKVYDEFISSLQDTASASKVDFKDFVKNLSDYDNKYHRIVVESNYRGLFAKLQENIIQLIGRNEYYRKNKSIQEQSLKKSEEIFNKQLQDIDSLREVYNKVLLAERASNKDSDGGGNTFNFAKMDSKTNELELLKESRVVNEKLIELNKEKLRLTSIVNVISDFNPVGKPVNNVLRNKIIIWGVIFGLITMVVLIFRELNGFLNNYMKHKGIK